MSEGKQYLFSKTPNFLGENLWLVVFKSASLQPIPEISLQN